ncbi:hypothetical protein CSUI_010960 [Cystoisospora suis]|uniref:Transmembrane protein n=1 Tax=Cystoisospora suis TaxID=483139 RepID=A0A2C6JV41_9APIC|nr:hypothetical protein CSUI_010960 [Cystoisospora suis]
MAAQSSRASGATYPVSDAAPPQKGGAEPPARGRGLASLKRTGEETVQTGREQLGHEEDNTGDPGWGPWALRQPRLSRKTSFLRSSRTLHRPRSARKRLQLSIALLASVAAVHAAFIYMECYTRLSAGRAHHVETATRRRDYEVGSASRRLAWGGEKEQADSCSGLGLEERSEDAAEGQENQVTSGAGGDRGAEDDDDGGLQDAVQAELERLQSLMLGEEQERGEGSTQVQSYQFPPADEPPVPFLVQTLGFLLESEIKLSQLVKEGRDIADRAAALRNEGLTTRSSSVTQEMEALRKRAKEIVIVSEWVAEKICSLERATRYRSRKLNMTELLPVAVAASSWSLPTPDDPMNFQALAIVRVILGGVESFLDWVGRVKHHAETSSQEEDDSSGSDTSTREMDTLLNLVPRLRRAVSSLRERQSAWRTSARSHGFKLLDIAPDDTLKVSAFSLVNGLRRRFSLAGLPSAVEAIVLEGGLDSESRDLCDEVLRRRIPRLVGRAVIGSPRAKMRDQERVARARLALAVLQRQRTGPPLGDGIRRLVPDFGYTDW